MVTAALARAHRKLGRRVRLFKCGPDFLDPMALANRPAMQHVVITGRGAPPELLAAADTVTEMRLVKHAFQAGVAAMPGVEF